MVVGVLEWQFNLFSSVYQFLRGCPGDKAEKYFWSEKNRSQNLTRGFEVLLAKSSIFFIFNYTK